jgi:cell wall-associated NlpC family hydrolase
LEPTFKAPAFRVPARKGGHDAMTRRLPLIFALSFLALLFLVLPALAQATPVSDKKARAREIRSQVAKLDHKLEAVIEEYNYANDRLLAVRKQIRKNTVTLKVARLNLAVAHRNLSARVVALYKERPIEMLDVVLSAGSFEEITTQLDLMRRLGEHDTDIIRSVEHYQAEIKEKRVGLIADRKAAVKLLGEVAASKRTIQGKLAERKQMLAGVEAEIRRMERAEAAAAAARLAAATGNTNGGTTPNQRPIIPDQAGPGHPEVCAIAARYLGVKYVYGGASPSTGFDCSGFVMYVYAQVGISLPHYSGSMQQMGTPVSMSALLPGDLVFRGNPAYHVGIYVGGGTCIHSPHTGSVVSYQSVGSWESAVRL